MRGHCKNAIRINRILQLAQIVALIEFWCGVVRSNPKREFLDAERREEARVNVNAGLTRSAFGGMFAGQKLVIFVSMQSTYIRHSFSVALPRCDQERNGFRECEE